jgi:hypothetical protein
MNGQVTLQVDRLSVAHTFEDDGRLSLHFKGAYLGGYDKVFEVYTGHLQKLVELTEDGSVAAVSCHVEELQQILSRAKHAIFSMIQAMRPNVQTITIHAAGAKPENRQHLRMMKVFIEETRGSDGATVKLVELFD